MNNKLNVITKLFGEKKIRTVWNNEEEKYYISVVDIVTALVDSNNPRHYWNALKSRLKQEGNETVTNCDQLKLKAHNELEKQLDESVVTDNNYLTYEYEDNKKELHK